MRLAIVIGAALLLGTATWSDAAAVNCKQVKKYLDTGRSVKDVAETMVIDEAEVKKCQEQAPAAAGTDTTKTGGEAKPADPMK
jgi:hypothetical protein